jgi:reactive intermediate/imine deaminase
MAKQALESPHVAKTKGPYVQGVEVTDAKLVFTSGVIARDAAGVIVGAGDIRAQTRQCLQNVRHIIEAAGGSLADLVKVTVFLRDLATYDGMNEVRREVLGGIQFASSTIQAALNAPEALIEVEAVAAVPLRSRAAA